MLDLQNHNFLHFYQNPDTETLPNKFRFCQCHSTNIYRLRQTIKSNVFPHNINFQMNPCEIPQNSKRQSSYNLDESQSSSVSIKIYNKNDEDVVIRLYRNNNKSSRDRFNNSFGHQRKSAGRESKTKQKPTMLRNLYRTTFGPTLDETVLVGMETFQICQQEVALNNRAMNAKNPSNEESRNNLIAPHPSREDLQNTDCCNCMPNELSWDCSTLLPANSNPKEFETVCTNTINSEADKEKNLSPLLTNQYHYSPFSNQNEDVCSDPRCSDSVKPAKSPKKSKQKEDKPRPLNNISSDDNLSKHISSEGINASYQTDITRSTITDIKHDNYKTLASISTWFGSKDPSYIVSEWNLQQQLSDDAGIYSSECEMMNEAEKCGIGTEITKSLYLLYEQKLPGMKQDVEASALSTCTENCSVCQEFLKKYKDTSRFDRQTETEEPFTSRLLLNFKKKEYFQVNHPESAAFVTCKYDVSKIRKSKSDPGPSSTRRRSKIKSPEPVTSTLISFSLEPSKSTLKNEEILVIYPSQEKTHSTNSTENLKVAEFHEVPSWERQKTYPTARFIQRKMKKPLLKMYSRLTAGSDRPSNMLLSSCSTSSWMTHHSLKNKLKKIPSYKTREIFKDLKKVDTKPVLKVRHVLSTSSSSFTTTTSFSSSIWSPPVRQKSGTNPPQKVLTEEEMIKKLDLLEGGTTFQKSTGKERLNNSDIMLPPSESYVQDSSVYTQTSAVDPLSKEQQEKSKFTNTRKTECVVSNVQNSEVVPSLSSRRIKTRKSSVFRPKEEYCKSTAIVYTSDPSTAGICPDIQDVNKIWDRNDNVRTRRKPLLEKLVDVISDYSKRTTLSHYPTCSRCNKPALQRDSVRISAKRTPILQKLFEVFSKKNLYYSADSSVGFYDDRSKYKSSKTNSSCLRSSVNEEKRSCCGSQTRPSYEELVVTERKCFKLPCLKKDTNAAAKKSKSGESNETKNISCAKESKCTETDNQDDLLKRRKVWENSCLTMDQYTETDNFFHDKCGETKQSSAKQSCSVLKESNQSGRRNSGDIEESRKNEQCQTSPKEEKHIKIKKRFSEEIVEKDSCSVRNARDETNQDHVDQFVERKKSGQCHSKDDKTKNLVDVGKRRNYQRTSLKVQPIMEVKEPDSQDGSSRDPIKKDKEQWHRCSENSSQTDLRNPKSLSVSSSSPVTSLRNNQVNKEIRRSSADSPYSQKTLTIPLVSEKADRIINYSFVIHKQHKGIKLSDQVKIKKKKPKEVASTHVEEEDAFLKKMEKHNKTKKKRKSPSKKNICISEQDDDEKSKEIRAKLNKLLKKGIQMKINDLSPKIKKPLMWRSFMGNNNSTDVIPLSPQVKFTCKHKKQTGNLEEQTQYLQKKYCKKCPICSNESQTEDEEQNEDVCAFQDCSSAKSVIVRRMIKFEEAVTNKRCAGGCEHGLYKKKTVKLPCPSPKEENGYCKDYLPYPSPRQTRRLPREAPASNEICEKPRLGICRCEKGDTSRNKVPQETRYAITRVTKYDDYTTYEILKSTRARPRKIPEVLEKIFIEKDPYY